MTCKGVSAFSPSWISNYVLKVFSVSLSVFVCVCVCVSLSFLPLFLIAYQPNSHRQMMWESAMGKEIWPPVVLSPHPCSYEAKGHEIFPASSTEKTRVYSNWPSLHQMPAHVSKGQTGHMTTSVPKSDQGIKIDCPNETQME